MGKASASNAGDPGSIPGSGRSPGAGNGNSILLPGKSHGLRSLVGPQSRTRLSDFTSLHCVQRIVLIDIGITKMYKT